MLISRPYFTYQIPSPDGSYTLPHDSTALSVFLSRDRAEKEATKNKLEIKIIDITDLVNNGIIPITKIRIVE